MNLPAGVPTLKRSAHYRHNQLKKILEAKKQVEIHIGKIWRMEGYTSEEVTDDTIKPNIEMESNANPVENPVSDQSNMSNF